MEKKDNRIGGEVKGLSGKRMEGFYGGKADIVVDGCQFNNIVSSTRDQPYLHTIRASPHPLSICLSHTHIPIEGLLLHCCT